MGVEILSGARHARLQEWLSERLGAPDLDVEGFEPMSGGSIQENWRVRCRFPDDGKTGEFVVRRDSPATIASSRSRRDEFRILGDVQRLSLQIATLGEII